MVLFHLLPYRTVHLWDALTHSPIGAKIMAGLSLSLWIGVDLLRPLDRLRDELGPTFQRCLKVLRCGARTSGPKSSPIIRLSLVCRSAPCLDLTGRPTPDRRPVRGRVRRRRRRMPGPPPSACRRPDRHVFLNPKDYDRDEKLPLTPAAVALNESAARRPRTAGWCCRTTPRSACRSACPPS